MQLSFGMNARQLNSSMHGYLNKSRFRVARVDLGSPETVIVPPGRDVSEVETLQFLAEIMFTSGTQPHRLASVIEAARSRAPEWAAVQALRMRLAVRDRDDAALQQLLAEIEPRLADARAARSVGLALYERVRASESSHAPPAMDVGALSVRALDLLSRALAAEPDDVQVVCAYALLAAQLKQDIAGALNRVQKMRAHLPSNGELAMAAALLYDAQGEPQEVNPYLAEVVELSNWDEQRRWAALRLGRRSGDP
jgi:tetratricopeptide (TPR) repeat protein